MITHVPYEPPQWVTRIFDRMFPKQTSGTSERLAPNQLPRLTKTENPACKRIVPKVRRRHIPFTRLQAERDLVTRLAFGETVAQQDDLVARWHVDKSTVSKWLKRWEGEGLIPARTQSGRCKSLAKA
jgi:hypothetical protein